MVGPCGPFLERLLRIARLGEEEVGKALEDEGPHDERHRHDGDEHRPAAIKEFVQSVKG